MKMLKVKPMKISKTAKLSSTSNAQYLVFIKCDNAFLPGS